MTTNITALTQDIINAINGKVEGTVHLNNERTLESHFDAIDRFETSINVLAMNNRGDRYEDIENEDGTTDRKWFRGRDKAVAKELWNGRLQYTMYKSETDKYQPKKATAKATIKATIKNLPDRTIGKNTVTNNDKEFTPKLASTNSYRVEGYRYYNSEIVLELIDTDKERTAYQNRETKEENQQVIHLVFRYEPFNTKGQPNEYDGIKQLRDFIKSQKFIMAQKPTGIRDALDKMVGCTIQFPSLYSFNYTAKSDKLTVYTVFGDFDEFDKEFTQNEKSEYQSISEYSLIDKDAFGYENLSQMIYNKDSNDNLQSIIIKYDCHKEFRQPLTLEYSHLSAMFD